MQPSYISIVHAFFLHLLKYNIIRGKGEKNNNLKTLALETQKQIYSYKFNRYI